MKLYFVEEAFKSYTASIVTILKSTWMNFADTITQRIHLLANPAACLVTKC